MRSIIFGGLAWALLLGCQPRQQPHAPGEGVNAATNGADSYASDQAQNMPPVANEGAEIGTTPITDPGAQDDGFFPENCLALKDADPSLPSGIYSIYPMQGALRSMAIAASCDMETDGGGWTLILNYNHQATTNPELNVRTDSLPVLGSNVLGMDESIEPEHWGHAGNEMLRTLTGFRELRFYCRSSENTRVLHFKTEDASCLSAVQLGNGSCANIRNNFVAMNDHTAILPALSDRAESDRFDETLTYNTFGQTEADTPDRMWSIRAEPSQQVWECDYGTNNAMFHTLHRVWVR